MLTIILIVTTTVLGLCCHLLNVENTHLSKAMFKEREDYINKLSKDPLVQSLTEENKALHKELQRQRNLTRLWQQAWKEHAAATILPPELLDCLWTRNNEQ
jgi:hypothetical protein